MSAFTTLRVGGAPVGLIAVDSFDQAMQTLSDLDDSHTPYAPLGGGSNLVVADDGVPFTVVWLRHRALETVADSAASVVVRVDAGMGWDEFVTYCVERNWSGLESLSGIPGSVGATPIQNVGAYGHDVSECVVGVRAWDRVTRSLRDFTRDECEFAYRDSWFKRSRMDDGTPRFIVLTVDFHLAHSEQSSPVVYAELATALGVTIGSVARLDQVRQSVLDLRRRKGMVLDADDHDTWSVGSFFVNPIVPAHVAATLPSHAPRWSVEPADDTSPETDTTDDAHNGSGGGGKLSGTAPVKVSAAWLIEHSGFSRGFSLSGSGAALSQKHTLAITNRGSASSDDIAALARAIQGGVRSAFGIELQPEPVLWGVDL